MKDIDDQEKNAIMDVRLVQERNMNVPKPIYVSFNKNIVFLSEQTISKV